MWDGKQTLDGHNNIILLWENGDRHACMGLHVFEDSMRNRTIHCTKKYTTEGSINVTKLCMTEGHHVSVFQSHNLSSNQGMSYLISWCYTFNAIKTWDSIKEHWCGVLVVLCQYSTTLDHYVCCRSSKLKGGRTCYTPSRVDCLLLKFIL